MVPVVGLGHHTAGGTLYARAGSSRAGAIAGLVGKGTSSGMRALHRRSGASAQAFGSYHRTSTGYIAWGSVSQQVPAI